MKHTIMFSYRNLTIVLHTFAPSISCNIFVVVIKYLLRLEVGLIRPMNLMPHFLKGCHVTVE